MDSDNKKPYVLWIVLFTLTFTFAFTAFSFLFSYKDMASIYEKKSLAYTTGEAESKPDKSEFFKIKASYFFTRPSSDKFLPIIMLSAAAGAFFVYKSILSHKRNSQNKDIEGKDRWAMRKEIRKNFYEVDDRHLDQAEKAGVVIARYGHKYYVDTTTTHSLIVGTTQSGKTQTYVLPNIRVMCSGKDKQSFIINDAKGELLENSYDMLKENGYNIVVLNLRNTDRTSCWNPLIFIINKYKDAMDKGLDLSLVNEYIDIISEVLTQNAVSDPIWPAAAKSTLTAMILYLIELGYKTGNLDKVNLYSVCQLFIEYGQPEVDVVDGVAIETTKLDKIFQSLPMGNPAKAAYATAQFAKGDMQASVFATLAEDMSLLGRDMGIASLTAGNDIDFIELFNDEQPTAIFMVIPDNRPARHCIASMFINQAYLALNEYLDENDLKSMPRTVNFILDEFANMVTIPGMETKITVSASRNILFHMYIQDLNQLVSKYDKTAKTIQSNCGNTIYIYSLDPDTNKYFSEILGVRTVEYATYSGKIDEGNNQRSIQYKGKPLMSPTELSVMKYGQTVIKRQRMYPIKTTFDFFYKLGIKPTKLRDIPTFTNTTVLADCIFPFEIVNQQLFPELVTESQVENTNRQDVPDIPLRSPDTYQEQNTAHKPKATNPSPIFIAIQEADNITGRDFSRLLADRNIEQLKKLLNQIKIKKQLPDQAIELLKTYIDRV